MLSGIIRFCTVFVGAMWFSSAYAIDVAVQVEAQLNADSRVVVKGKTNLPQGTKLLISVSHAATGDIYGQADCTVDAGGVYRTVPIGPTSGLLEGDYSADVTMPTANTQPVSVQKVIGDKGQNLQGKLVTEDVFGLGPAIETQQRFAVGGGGALAGYTQEGELVQIKSMRSLMTNIASRLDMWADYRFSSYSENEKQKAMWVDFVHWFNGTHGALMKQVDAMPSASVAVRMSVGMPLGQLRTMYNALPAENNASDTVNKNAFTRAKAEFVKYLAELDDFIQKRGSGTPGK